MQAVRGRILYDFTGSACEGYALQFRQVSELDSGEGKVVVSDLRATSWEEGAAKRLRFHSQNFFDDKLRETVDGQAEREPGGVAVKLTQPDGKNFDLKSDVAFPTEHVRRIIAAARERKTLLRGSGLRRLRQRRENLRHALRDRPRRSRRTSTSRMTRPPVSRRSAGSPAGR